MLVLFVMQMLLIFMLCTEIQHKMMLALQHTIAIIPKSLDMQSLHMHQLIIQQRPVMRMMENSIG